MSQENEKVTILVASCIYNWFEKKKESILDNKTQQKYLGGNIPSIFKKKLFIYVILYLYGYNISFFYRNPCNVSY